jgi:hypothetical protein
MAEVVIVGFTGTRRGMTAYQKAKLRELLEESGCIRFHHGDCLGADAEAHDIAADLGLRTIVHPPDITTYRAWCKGTVVRPERPYLTRNRDIVLECDVLFAAPAQALEIQRSGTWSTVRVARKLDRPVCIISPEELT